MPIIPTPSSFHLALTPAVLYELAYYHGRKPDNHLTTFLGALFCDGRRRTLLDCACGTGEPGLHLAPLLETTCVDASEDMIVIAKAKAKRLGVSPRFIAARWSELGRLLVERFDVVMCAGAALCQIEERAERRRSLSAMSARVASGGLFYIDYLMARDSVAHASIQTSVVGPFRHKGDSLLVIIHERYSHHRIDRTKTCLSVITPTPRIVLQVHSFTILLPEEEIRGDLLALGLRNIKSFHRPGRWPMNCLLAER